MLRAPSFWFLQHTPPEVYLLWPFAQLYCFFGWLRALWHHPKRAPFPVISVGNAVMGGAGKTPIVIALCDVLKNEGYRPIIISRGYGGKSLDPQWVDPFLHTFQDVGDEPLLLAQHAPTIVSRRRHHALKLIPQEAKVVLVLDDGHQQRDLCVDLNFLVVDHKQGWGNTCVFPMGPLRESRARALKRTDAVIAVDGISDVIDKPLFFAAFVPETSLVKKTSVWGVAGIGYPKKFERTLHALGLSVKGFTAFSDHHPYSLSELQSVAQRAERAGAQIVTTEKDVVRWAEGATLPKVIKLSVRWKTPEKLAMFVTEHLKKHSETR